MKLETKVGAFFLATIAVLGLLIIRTEKLDLFGKKNGRRFGMDFQQVAGLSLQSQVRVAGVKVGTVQEIKLEQGKARVIIGVPDDLPIYADASVQLSSLGILGEKYVDLNQGHSTTGPLAEEAIIPSQEGVSLDNLMETLAAIGKDVQGRHQRPEPVHRRRGRPPEAGRDRGQHPGPDRRVPGHGPGEPRHHQCHPGQCRGHLRRAAGAAAQAGPAVRGPGPESQRDGGG